MRLIAVLWGILGIAAGISGCGFLNPAEPIPAYVTFREPKIQIVDKDTFRSPLGVRDVWVSLNDDKLGVYQMPCTIPVYPRDGGELLVSGGVFENGLSINREKYPFWRPLVIPFTAKPLDTVVIEPTFRYYSQDTVLYFPFAENFESSSMKVSPREGNEYAFVQRSASQKYTGNYSATVKLTDARTKMELQTPSPFALPRTKDNDTWLEITYKGDFTFTIGLQYASSSGNNQNVLGIYFGGNSSQWQTSYIHLNDLISNSPSDAVFGLFLRGEGNSGQQLFLDNLRIVCFK